MAMASAIVVDAFQTASTDTVEMRSGDGAWARTRIRMTTVMAVDDSQQIAFRLVAAADGFHAMGTPQSAATVGDALPTDRTGAAEYRRGRHR